MRVIANLFGKSPFFPLQEHMESVVKCVSRLVEMFDILKQGKHGELETLAKEISKLEHKADVAKNEIRNHLPKNLLLPIDREMLLNMLSLQDSIADAAEDTAVLLTLKNVNLEDDLLNDLQALLKKNVHCFDKAHMIIKHLHELFQSSFGGVEAESVKAMVEDVAYQEHQVDLDQRKLLKKIFNLEEKLSYSSFYLVIKLIESFAKISDHSEKLANCIRTTIERR